MSHNPIRDRLQTATEAMMASMKPGRRCSVHTMTETTMVDGYRVYLAWYEGNTRYSVFGVYNAYRNRETPEEWVDRALRVEVSGRGESALPEGLSE